MLRFILKKPALCLTLRFSKRFGLSGFNIPNEKPKQSRQPRKCQNTRTIYLLKLKMSLNAPLLGTTAAPTTVDLSVTESAVAPILAYFDARKGPQLLDAPKGIPGDLAMRMFPPTWREGAVFVFQAEGFYAICCGATSRHVQHARGFTNLTVAIVSSTPAFDQRQLDFVLWGASAVADQEALDVKILCEEYERRGFNQPVFVSHPFKALLRKGACCSTFRLRPQQALTLWRARLAGARITVACTTDLEAACALCYFVGAMAMPLVCLDECAFHLDMCDADRVRGGGYKVCAVTHRGLQKEDLSPVMLLEGGVVKLSEELRWLARGGGSVLAEISGAQTDEDMLTVFFDLSKRLNTACQSRAIDKDDLRRMGLDRRSARVISLFAAERGLAVSVEVNDGCCGLC